MDDPGILEEEDQVVPTRGRSLDRGPVDAVCGLLNGPSNRQDGSGPLAEVVERAARRRHPLHVVVDVDPLLARVGGVDGVVHLGRRHDRGRRARLVERTRGHGSGREGPHLFIEESVTQGRERHHRDVGGPKGSDVGEAVGERHLVRR